MICVCVCVYLVVFDSQVVPTSLQMTNLHSTHLSESGHHTTWPSFLKETKPTKPKLREKVETTPGQLFPPASLK